MRAAILPDTVQALFPAPPLLPAPQKFSAICGYGLLNPAARIMIATPAEERLRTDAALLARQLVADGHVAETPSVVVGGHPRSADIVLRLAAVAGSAHPEGYALSCDGPITITGPTTDGVFWGTRTLLQLLRSGPPRGSIVDWPALAERGVMLDIGRKHFSADWIKALIREMSYLKLNVLQLHLSDGLGFRVECDSHPEIVSATHLTKAEVRDILAVARTHHVRVYPDIDTPGHLDHILSAHPECQLVLADGTRQPGHLDFSRPAARRLIHEIVAEIADLFDGGAFHLGGDEYFPAPWQATEPGVVTDDTAPRLVAYARAATGDDAATAHDGFDTYLNELADLVRAKGYRARVWNDHVRPGGGAARIDPRTQVDVWIRWNRSEPTAADYAAAGHEIINANGDYLYLILTPDGLGRGPNKNPRGIYERWTPRMFMGAAGNAGDFHLPPDTPLQGAHLSVWCDTPDSMTQAEVASQAREWLQVFAQQTWGSPKIAGTLDRLRSTVLPVVGMAPPTT